MLEIRNVTKIYKTKGGVLTKALDDVSISFAETGLVFLLGKSGSGKSTLLNVSGGLDDPTSGEIIVKGKSSKSFSGADFDSYRNTFVGFVFQEYNILDEFNVEDNIALALELQGKPKDKAKINALLEEVDLKDYAKRKPNTLSGGQKQRIAIARALIKDPQIIMADEPTGALDSATGKQVFDTLKKLSETRLVIVVSHDREFAEMYGDRIVELKDGKIISDETKRSIAPEELDKNVSIVGGDTLTIKSGAELTTKNIAAINEFLKGSQGDIIITRGEKELSAFRKANRMSESGSTESFSETVPDDVPLKGYEKEDSKFIRSRLPAGKAIKIGASGLKLKPLRLFFTILLSFIAFTLFGLLSTLMTYDGNKVAAQSFADSDSYNYLNISKSYLVRVTYDDDYSYTYTNQTRLTQKEVDGFASRYGSASFGYRNAQYDTGINNLQISKENLGSYYFNDLSKFAYVPDGNQLRKDIKGEYPKSADEVCISSYLVEAMVNGEVYGLKEDGSINSESKLTVRNAEDIIGKQIIISSGYNGGAVFTVTGVFDSGKIPETYSALKEDSQNVSFTMPYRYRQYLSEEMHQMAFVTADFFDEHEAMLAPNYGGSREDPFDWFDNSAELQFKNEYSEDTGYFSGVQYLGARDCPYDINFLDGKNREKLADDEMIVNGDMVYRYFWYALDDYISGENGKFDFDLLPQMQTDLDKYFRGEYQKPIYKTDDEGREYIDGYEWVKATKEERKKAKATIDLLVEVYGLPTVTVQIDSFPYENIKIVGVYVVGDIYYGDGVYVSQNFYNNFNVYRNDVKYETNYVQEEGEIYDGVFIPYDHTEATFLKLLGEIGEENATERDVVYVLNASLWESVAMANFYADLLSTIFLWAGLVFAVFASLLMFNFISMSISNKRKEIGILRAVGARGTDVFKIFFAESGIIVGICTLLSLIGTLVLCKVINGILNTEIGFAVSLFVFSWLSIVMMVGLALLVALISTFLPVYFAARKKPVESIRAL